MNAVEDAYREALSIMAKDLGRSELINPAIELAELILRYQQEDQPAPAKDFYPPPVIVYDRELGKGRAKDWARLKTIEDLCVGIVERTKYVYPDGSAMEKVPAEFMKYLRAWIKQVKKELPL